MASRRAALALSASAHGLSSRSIENNVGKLEGTLTLANGEIPVSMQLVNGDAGWQVQNLRKAVAGAQLDTGSDAPAPARSPVEGPDRTAQRKLIADTLAAFAESVNGNDFSILRDSASRRFQDAVSVERLAEAFAPFVDQGLDLSVPDGMLATIETSVIDDAAVLPLDGYYDTQPSRTGFKLQYEREGEAWKLIEIDVQVH